MKIVVITGEESGDYLGAALLSALEKFYDQKLDIYGIGGKALKNKGIKNFYDISEFLGREWDEIEDIDTLTKLEYIDEDELGEFNSRFKLN